MHKVVKSYLDKFTKEHSLEDVDESQRFERFANFLIISSYFPEHFELDEVTTGSDDNSIDGVAVFIGEELAASRDDAEALFGRLRGRRQVPVAYAFVQAKRSERFDAGDILKFGDGVRKLVSDEQATFADPVLHEFRLIHEYVVDQLPYVKSGRPECNLFYCCTGVWNTDSGLSDRLDSVKLSLEETGLFDTIEALPVDREQLIKLWNQVKSPVQATLPVKSFVPLPSIAGVEEAYLAVASATEFVDKLIHDKDGRIRSSVFEHNVRAYLGDDNPVNSKIRAALDDKETHDRFAILNNGLTIVAPDVRVQSDKVSVSGYQIVNGCQTSHVLYRNRHLLTEDIFVPLKIIEADDPEIVAQIVEATNSQSDVGETQFISIRPFVRKLQAYFDSFDTEDDRDKRLFFERRTKQYSDQDIGKVRVFDIQRLARAFAAMFLGVPHLAARYPTQTFREREAELFQEDHREVAYYTAALALYRLELSLGNKYVPRTYQRYKWHLLMIAAQQIAGFEVPKPNSRRLEDYCDRIISAFSQGGKASAEPFLDAVEVIDHVGEAGRDRLKGLPYTQELMAEIRRRSSAT